MASKCKCDRNADDKKGKRGVEEQDHQRRQAWHKTVMMLVASATSDFTDILRITTMMIVLQKSFAPRPVNTEVCHFCSLQKYPLRKKRTVASHLSFFARKECGMPVRTPAPSPESLSQPQAPRCSMRSNITWDSLSTWSKKRHKSSLNWLFYGLQ